MKRALLLLFLIPACADVQTTEDAPPPELELSIRTCERHARPLEIRSVNISYGLPIMPERSYVQARAVFFPHAEDAPHGGCFPRGGTAEVEACAACDRAEERWVAMQPRFTSRF